MLKLSDTESGSLLNAYDPQSRFDPGSHEHIAVRHYWDD